MFCLVCGVKAQKVSNRDWIRGGESPFVCQKNENMKLKISSIIAMETMGKRANTSSVIHGAISNLPSVFWVVQYWHDLSI